MPCCHGVGCSGASVPSHVASHAMAAQVPRTGGGIDRAASPNSDRSVESAENTRRWRTVVADTAALSGAAARSTALVIWLSRLGVILRATVNQNVASMDRGFRHAHGCCRQRSWKRSGPAHVDTVTLAAGPSNNRCKLQRARHRSQGHQHQRRLTTAQSWTNLDAGGLGVKRR